MTSPHWLVSKLYRNHPTPSPNRIKPLPYGVDRTCALFSESTGRVLVSVGREDDVKFVGLCEARGIPVLRVGVTDNSGELEIQDVATWQLNDLRGAHEGTLAEFFG